jgi:cysteine desulfuration protein SufE
MKIEEIENEIISEFEMLDNWEDKYQYVIDMGKDLHALPEELKTDDRLIKGCQSRVWLQSDLKDGKVIYSADSDAIITKGLVALMIRVLSGQAPDDIMTADMHFVDRIGLKEHLSPTRANGLLSMIKQMKLDAMALKTKLSS